MLLNSEDFIKITWRQGERGKGELSKEVGEERRKFSRIFPIIFLPRFSSHLHLLALFLNANFYLKCLDFILFFCLHSDCKCPLFYFWQGKYCKLFYYF